MLHDWNSALASCITIYGAGYTAIFNEYHCPENASGVVEALRKVRVAIDRSATAAYGLGYLDLGHGFHETKQGVRYTISESARRIVLDRLLALNHQRYAEEVKAGLHDKGKKPKGQLRKEKPAAPPQGELLVPPQTDLFA